MFGHAQHELVGLHRSEFVAKAAQLAAVTDERLRQGIAKAEIEYLRRDGTRFVGAMTAVDDGEGEAKLVWVLVRDLSANRAAEHYVGVGPGGMVGRQLLEFIAAKCHDEVVAKISTPSCRPVVARPS